VPEEEDFRTFLRQMMARNDKILMRVISTFEMRTDALVVEMRDVRDESRAQRAALLAILDKLNGPRPSDA
jgi:hypothetical protein